MKKKLLYICARCPVPPLLKGDQKRSFEFLRALHSEYNVDLVTFHDRRLSDLDHQQLERLTGRYFVYYRNKFLALASVLLGFLLLRPFQNLYFSDMRMYRLVDQLCKENNYDVIFCQLSRMADYVKDKKTSGVKVLDMQDRFSLNMIRRSKFEVNLIKKSIFRYEAWLVDRYEKKIIKYFDKVIAVAMNDFTDLAGESGKVSIVPIAFLPTRFNTARRSLHLPIKIVFFGNMGYFPNYDATIWFIEVVAPILRKTISFEFRVIGSSPPDRLKSLTSADIFIDGYVEEDQYVRMIAESDIAVFPIRAGSGMQNKVLEAICAGLPVVCSQQVADAIPELNEAVIVSELSPTSFVASIKVLIDNFNDYQNKVGGVAEKIRYIYGENVVTQKLIDILWSSYNEKGIS